MPTTLLAHKAPPTRVRQDTGKPLTNVHVDGLDFRPVKVEGGRDFQAGGVSVTEPYYFPSVSDVAGAQFFAGDAWTIGEHGAAAGQFQHPVGLAVMGGILLVSEFTGRRVQGLDAQTRAAIFIIPSPFGTRLLGVCATTAGRIYAGDFDTDRIHVWGQPLGGTSLLDSFERLP